MVSNLKRHRFLGRPVKPLALGLILALFPAALNGWVVAFGYPSLLDSTGDDMAIGIVATLALTLMVGGWFRKSQSMFEAALLFVVGAFTARAFLIVFLNPHPLEAMFPFAVAVIAGGAYVLEREGQVRGEEW